MRVAPSVRAVSISGAAAVTTISSETAACFSLKLSVRVWPTARSIPFCTDFANPSSMAVTWYGPSGSSTPRKRPAESVIAVCSKFVAVLWMVTVTPGSAAPVASTTVPSMTPVVAWDCAKSETGRRRRSNAREKRRMCVPPCDRFLGRRQRYHSLQFLAVCRHLRPFAGEDRGRIARHHVLAGAGERVAREQLGDGAGAQDAGSFELPVTLVVVRRSTPPVSTM